MKREGLLMHDHVVVSIICINKIIQMFTKKRSSKSQEMWTGSLYVYGADYFSARFAMQKMDNKLICSIRFKFKFTSVLCLAKNSLTSIFF